MFSQIFKIFLVLFLFIASIADAHSWVHCTDYTGTGNDLNYHNPSQCRSLPRAWYKNQFYNAVPRNDQFGVDGGYNIQVNLDGSGTRCPGTATIGFDANYQGRQNVVRYMQGETYRLTWPAKNHAAATCTNRFIPDTSLDVFVFKQQDEGNMRDPTQDEFNRTPLPTSFGADPHVQGQIDFKGFQNCPRFCEDQDKAFCHGTFTVPDNLEPGIYTFQWNWLFNRDVDRYTTCWEAFIDAAPTTTSSAPQSSIPEATTSSPETTFGIVGSTCYNPQCGCPSGGYSQNWCTDSTAVLTNEYCLQSQEKCERDCNGVWCTLNAPIDPNAPCTSDSLVQDRETNHFIASCNDPTPIGETCLINHDQGYSNGEVRCIGGTWRYTPAVCDNCCQGGQILAPGSDTLVPYSDITPGNTGVISCPDGFAGTFTLLCTQEGAQYRVSLSDGVCSVSCRDDLAQEFYDRGVNAAEDDSSSDVVITLIVVLIIETVMLITYVLYKEHMLCFKESESVVAGNINSSPNWGFSDKKRESIERHL